MERNEGTQSARSFGRLGPSVCFGSTKATPQRAKQADCSGDVSLRYGGRIGNKTVQDLSDKPRRTVWHSVEGYPRCKFFHKNYAVGCGVGLAVGCSLGKKQRSGAARAKARAQAKQAVSRAHRLEAAAWPVFRQAERAVWEDGVECVGFVRVEPFEEKTALHAHGPMERAKQSTSDCAELLRWLAWNEPMELVW